MNFNIFLFEISTIKQSKKDLRNFGYVFFVAGLVFAGISFYKHGWESRMILIFSAAGTIFLLCGLFVPVILKPLNKLWMILSIVLGYFVTRIILSIAFVLIIIPFGMLLRLMKKDVLDLDMKKDEKTFWKDHQNDNDKKRYEKMF